MQHSQTRRTYAHTHSELRGLARYKTDRVAALRRICDDRRFWSGDLYSAPASPGALAALKTIRGRLWLDHDVLSLHSVVAAKTTGAFPASASIVVHRAVLASLRARPIPVLP